MGFTFNPFTGNFDKVNDVTPELEIGSFAAANNQSVPTNVTGLDLSAYKGAKVMITVEIDATADLYEVFTLDIIQKGADFDLFQASVGDDSGCDFTISSGGQAQYTSGNESGFSSSTFTWTITGVK